MQPEILVQTLVNGLFLGGVYALVAVGLTMIYGVMMVINFAHGEFLMLGMYFTYWAFVLAGLDPYVAVTFVAVILFLIGLAVQQGFIRPILNAPMINQILLTLGLSILIMGLVQFFWRAEPRSILVPYSADRFVIAGIVLNIPRLVAFIASLVISISLYLFLLRSKIGKAIRACSQSRLAASLMGINVNRIYMVTFGIGVALTGIAGALLTPSFPMTPTIGQTFSITAFVIVVLGTMGNFLGALIGALIIGVAEAFGGLFLGSAVKQVVSMGIFILVLLVRPGGLFGGSR